MARMLSTLLMYVSPHARSSARRIDLNHFSSNQETLKYVIELVKDITSRHNTTHCFRCREIQTLFKTKKQSSLPVHVENTTFLKLPVSSPGISMLTAQHCGITGNRGFSTHVIVNKVQTSDNFNVTTNSKHNSETRMLKKSEWHLATSSFSSCSVCLPSIGSMRGLKTLTNSQSFINPVRELQRFVSVPIIPDNGAVFSPTEAEVAAAFSIFKGHRGSAKDHATFVGSFVAGGEVPDLNMPEVCFLGRSNVGKSSLISCLLGSHSQVKVNVSKKPGHTKTLNLYRVGQHFTLVDMPGYGHNMPHNFQTSVETYLKTSRRLCRTFLLLDGNVGLTSTDHIALEMLHEFSIPYAVVLTKIDKAGKHKLVRNLLDVQKVCGEKGGHTLFSQPFLVSSQTGDGVMLLQTFIAYIAGCIQIRGL